MPKQGLGHLDIFQKVELFIPSESYLIKQVQLFDSPRFLELLKPQSDLRLVSS